MCVAIYKPAGRHVSKKDLQACFSRNPDGAGFMYPSEDANGVPKVIVAKGYFDFKSFWDAYRDHAFGPAANQPMAIHFRIGTSGLKDVNNCHPHIVAEDFAFVHNGIMGEYAYTKSDFSDTHHFGQEVLKPLYDKMGMNFLDVGNVPTLLCEHIGISNKMIMMPAKGTIWILNKPQGTMRGDIWFSNTYWDTAPVRSYNYASDYSGRDNLGRYTGGKWGRGYRDVLAVEHGCWLDNQYYSWEEYDRLYPEKDGPFEYYLKRKGLQGRTPDPEPKVEEETKKDETSGNPQDPEGTINVEDANERCFMEDLCFICRQKMTAAEIEADEGLCTNCLADITKPLGATP